MKKVLSLKSLRNSHLNGYLSAPTKLQPCKKKKKIVIFYPFDKEEIEKLKRFN